MGIDFAHSRRSPRRSPGIADLYDRPARAVIRFIVNVPVLSGADHRGTAERFHRAQAPDDRPVLGHAVDADGQCHRDDRGSPSGIAATASAMEVSRSAAAARRAPGPAPG